MSIGRKPENPTAVILHFSPKLTFAAIENLAEFIQLCKNQSTVFGADLEWSSYRWRHVCQFTKLGTARQLREDKEDQFQLDATIVDLAKAYVRYQSGIQGFTPSRVNRWISSFRVIEKTLLTHKGTAHPFGLDMAMLDSCAQLIQEYYKPDTGYHVGQALKDVAKFLSENHLIPTDLSFWRSPIPSVVNQNAKIGKDAEAVRLKKMPDIRALDALAEIFAHGFDSRDPNQHKDIYTSSVSAILLGAPCRGQEVHDLPIDLEIEEADESGTVQYGLRYFSGKGFGHDIKWVPTVMVPVVKQAVQRLREITWSARKLALYIEGQHAARKRDPDAPLLFYRHPECPDVAEDQPLTLKQVSEALGLQKRALCHLGISTAPGANTLHSLWRWVLTRQPEEFPWLDKKKGVKYSEALFCMFARQLHATLPTSPVILWAPTLPIYNADVSKKRGVDSIFERYNYFDEVGKPLGITSHNLRHYLNTLANRGKMTAEEIAKWSGRASLKQNRVYNHETEFERAENIKNVLQENDGTLAVIGRGSAKIVQQEKFLDITPSSHWDVMLKPAPKSCADIDLAPRGANHVTLWGKCEHDFLFSPCETFGDCLNCDEHYCIKGDGTDDMQRLNRIKDLLKQVELEYESAKSAHASNYPGAENWHNSQLRYRNRLDQLVKILEDSAVPMGAAVRLRGGNNQTHLHRVLRAAAHQALQNNTVPTQVIENMLGLLAEDQQTFGRLDDSKLGES